MLHGGELETKHKTTLDQLMNLEDDLDAQAAYALSLVQRDRHFQTVVPALRVLAAHPLPEARPILRQRFAYFQSDWAKRDQGAVIRAALLEALRPLAQDDDRPLLEQAVVTYEFLPPTRSEVAAPLRAAALAALSALDDTLAGYWAVRLLDDEHTSRMSGEPALTAARILGAQRQTLPLYAYALRGAATFPEVLLECFRHLTTVPPSILATLVERHRATQDDVTLVGLIDLVLGHPAWESHLDFLRDGLTRPRQVEVYRYLVMALAASRKPALIDLLIQQAGLETVPARQQALVQALRLVHGDRDAEAAATALEQTLTGAGAGPERRASRRRPG